MSTFNNNKNSSFLSIYSAVAGAGSATSLAQSSERVDCAVDGAKEQLRTLAETIETAAARYSGTASNLSFFQGPADGNKEAYLQSLAEQVTWTRLSIGDDQQNLQELLAAPRPGK